MDFSVGRTASLLDQASDEFGNARMAGQALGAIGDREIARIYGKIGAQRPRETDWAGIAQGVGGALGAIKGLRKKSPLPGFDIKGNPFGIQLLQGMPDYSSGFDIERKSFGIQPL